MKVNYEEFLDRFESSGMTQQEFGKQEGLSASMVSYYVRRGRESREGGGFAQVKVVQESPTRQTMKIVYPSGVSIELPI